MKKIIIEDEKSAVEYIPNVLTKWDAFCIGHPKMTQALEILLQSVLSKGNKNEQR